MVKKIKCPAYIIFLIGIIFFFSSCDFLANPLHGRENPNDSAAQLVNVNVVQPASETIVGQAAVRDPLNYIDNEERVEEILLAYNIGSPLPTKYVYFFYPLDSGGIKLVSKRDGVFAYDWTIDGLSDGDEVWFAAYPKTTKGWQAPMFDKVTVKNPPGNITGPHNIGGAVVCIYADTGGGLQDITGEGINCTIENNGTAERIIIFQFDLRDDIYYTNAFLSFTVSSVSGTPPTNGGSVWPMSSMHFDWDAGRAMAYRDMNDTLTTSFTFANGMNTMDVTNAVNRAVLYCTNSIAIGFNVNTSATVEVTEGPESMYLMYYQ